MNTRKPSGRKPKLPPDAPLPGDFDSFIANFEHAIASPPNQERAWLLSMAASNTFLFRDLLGEDPLAAQRLIEIARAIRSAKGDGCAMAERKLMEYLTELAHQCRLQLEDDARKKHRAGSASRRHVPPQPSPCSEVLRRLCDYARDCLAYSRPHDSASGQRRSSAFEILAHAIQFADLTEVVAVARKCLANVNSPSVYGAMLFLQEYCLQAGLPPENDLKEELLALSARTRSRSIASSALGVLIKTGVITEMKALDRMDEWKDSRWQRPES